MTTVTVKMPDELHAALSKLSALKGVSKSQLIREALAAVLASELREQKVSALEVMRRGVGVVRSGRPDLGSNPDHLEGFGRP